MDDTTRRVSVLDELFDEEELFEAVARPECDISQTKPAGESRYTGHRLATADIRKPTRNIVEAVWMGLSVFISQQLEQKRVVKIPHIGKFKYILDSSATKGETMKEPVFIWDEHVLKAHGVTARSVPKGKLCSEEREINYTTVALLASLSKDQVVDTMRLLFEELGRKCGESKGQAVKVRVLLKDVGRFCCDRGMAKFSFQESWGTTRPGTSATCRGSSRGERTPKTVARFSP
jgi:hypothetical protein